MLLPIFRSFPGHVPAASRSTGRGRRRRARFRPDLLSLETRALLSTITVMNDADNGPGSLRAAIADAASGDTIDFAHTAYGTITLTSGSLVVPDINLTIQGPGANKLTISGDENYTVFQLGVQFGFPTTPANMTISGLTIADGDNTDGGSGGGILSAVNLTLADSVLKDNQAPRGSGGGISDAVNVSGLGLTIVNDLFEGNTAGSASVNVFSGDGGAIDAENGTVLSVSSSTFIDNQSISPEAEGGAISVIDNPFGFTQVHGSLTVTGSTFRGNVASSASSFGEGFVVGFYAAGGAIWADPQAGVTIGSSQFLSNEAELSDTLGNPGTVTGGAIEVTPVLTGSSATAQSPATITNSVFSGNLAVGTGNSGSTASGGAIDSGSFGFTDGAIITISGSTFAGNQAVGEDSSTNGVAGPAQGGAINTSETYLALTSDAFSRNEAVGGSGSGLQDALGGAINSRFGFSPSIASTTTISDSLFTGNQAKGGTGVPYFDDYVDGGAMALAGTPASVTNTSFIGNQALGTTNTGLPFFVSFSGPQAAGGAVEASGAALNVQGGLIAGNLAQGGHGGSDTTGRTGGNGGYGQGGGIFVGGRGSLTLTGTAITGNRADGGDGGQGSAGGNGGGGQGGGVFVSYGGSARLTDAALIGNTAKGGAGGQGTTTPGYAGGGQGGGVFGYAATLKISGGLIAGNSAIGGAGGGFAQGGGVFISGTSANASLTDVLITLNSAIGGTGGGQGYGGGLYIGSGAISTLKNTKVLGNFASTADNNIDGTPTTG